MQDEARGTWKTADRMRFELTLAKAMNKTSVSFATDSVLKEVAAYYDRYGSANLQLRAHYLLGCAYRDMNEAPMAVKCYYDAIDRADTQCADCDFTTLARVYGQLGQVFMAQHLPDKQIEAFRNYSHYAKKAGNTYEYIRGIECLVQPYYQLNDTGMVFQITERARNLYLQNGMKAAAASVYPTAISMAVLYEQWDRAKAMMYVFETLSGQFDSEHNVSKEYELYYQSKGLYFMGTNQLDSAEHYFRRLVTSQHALEGYRGLLHVYNERRVADSIFLFSKRYEAAMDAHVRNMQTQATQQTAALYDYTRSEHIAMTKSREAKRNRTIIIVGCIVACLAAIVLLVRGKARRKARKQLERAYATTRQELIQARQEMTYLQQNLPQQDESERFLASREQRIQELENTISGYQQELGILDTMQREELLMESDIVRQLQSICQPQVIEDKNGRKRHLPPRAASEKELKALRSLFKKHHLSFLLSIEKNQALTKLEYKVCLLSRLQLMTKDMSTLLDSSDQAISNARASIARKLFQMSRTSDLNARLKEL